MRRRLGSITPPPLVEVEAYVLGSDDHEAQKEATKLAQEVQQSLAYRTGLSPTSIVARGFPALNRVTDLAPKKMIQVIISGEFLGDLPSYSQ